MKLKNRSYRYDINGPKPRYSKYKKCLNMSQHFKLNLEKVKQHWGWVEQSVTCKKSVYL